jgi:hypothetical protein
MFTVQIALDGEDTTYVDIELNSGDELILIQRLEALVNKEAPEFGPRMRHKVGAAEWSTW